MAAVTESAFRIRPYNLLRLKRSGMEPCCSLTAARRRHPPRELGLLRLRSLPKDAQGSGALDKQRFFRSIQVKYKASMPSMDMLELQAMIFRSRCFP